MATSRPFSALLVVATIVAALGCSKNLQPPRADYLHGPLPQQFRRLADYRSETFWSRAHPEAYERLENLPREMSVDQDLIVQEYGNPEYSREFKSLEHEEVLEWIEMEHNMLFQFIEGELVYEGEVRDLEHVLLRRGYPNQVMYSLGYPQIERMTFLYRPVLSLDTEYYSFADGALVLEMRQP